MIITIYDNNKYEDEFFNWLITEIRIYVFSSIDDSKLLKIDNFQVLPSNTPKGLKFSFEIYNLAGKNVNIGVSI